MVEPHWYPTSWDEVVSISRLCAKCKIRRHRFSMTRDNEIVAGERFCSIRHQKFWTAVWDVVLERVTIFCGLQQITVGTNAKKNQTRWGGLTT